MGSRGGEPVAASGLLQRSAGAVQVDAPTAQSVKRRARCVLPAQANGRPPCGLQRSRNRESTGGRAQAHRSELVELHQWHRRLLYQRRKKRVAGGECLRQHRCSGHRARRSRRTGRRRIRKSRRTGRLKAFACGTSR